jgi:ribonucleoside-diphosphate reductase alpha chain
MIFRNEFGQVIFDQKYRNDAGGCDTWSTLADTLVLRVCKGRMAPGDMTVLASYIRDMKFIPAGRYLYYAGREASFFNNCYSFIAEDTREGWADLASNHFKALMSGGGCGTYYGNLRERGSAVSTTGGVASGPVPLMHAMNECGRNVMQGGSRRSALYASLPWDHPDIEEFLTCKNYSDEILKAKEMDFNFAAPMDMTNISVQYDSQLGIMSDIFEKNIKQAMVNGEPGFQFDLRNPDQVARNACTEFISDSDSDMCNLGSINLSRIKNPTELAEVVELASKFLVCGSVLSKLPYEKCDQVRNEKRKIGLGLMGVHEWLMARGYQYEMNDELRGWLDIYESESKRNADIQTMRLNVSQCVKYRAIAPAGTISLIAGTTSGIEPLFATSLKRRWFDHGSWKLQYIIDPVAKYLHEQGMDVEDMETSYDLSRDIERRIVFQADIQGYVDMGISSTINLPAWGTEFNNDDLVPDITSIVRRYAHLLRGLTFYPDGSRGGQPLTAVSWDEAIENEGETFEENMEILQNTCKGGSCGI